MHSPELVIRPESHEIDSLARRRIPNSLPKEWEHRELTGRDYGIDMIVELFDKGSALGGQLLLQIKGTTQDIPVQNNTACFDLPVKTLRYAELFQVPVLLAVCPVNKSPMGFYYLWLQDYIHVVLANENPQWRENEYTVRLKLPLHNHIPGNETHIQFIGNYPRRLYDWGQVGRLLHELRYAFWTNDLSMLMKDDIAKGKSLLEKTLELRGLFGDPNFRWGQFVRSTIQKGITAADLLLRGEPYTIEEVESLGIKLTTEGLARADMSLLDFQIRSVLFQSENSLSASLATGNDDALKYHLWKETGDHDF